LLSTLNDVSDENEKPREITYRELIENRKRQMVEVTKKKPMAAQSLSFRVKAACHLAAFGMSNKDIAEQLNLSKERVSTILNGPSAKYHIEKLQKEMFMGDATKAFQAMVPKALRTTRRLLSKNAKEAVQLGAAREVFDRTYGKPKQTVEHQGSALKELFSELDRRDKAKAGIGDATEGIIDAEFHAISDADDDRDEMDRLLDDIL
jgi:predicted transcriptional regulator